MYTSFLLIETGLGPFSRDRSRRPFSRFTGLWRAEKQFKYVNDTRRSIPLLTCRDVPEIT